MPDVLAAVRSKHPRESVHCLPAADRFAIKTILTTASFASFAPDGIRLALETPTGIEILNRDDGTRTPVTPAGYTLAGNAWHPDGTVLLVSGPPNGREGRFRQAGGRAHPPPIG